MSYYLNTDLFVVSNQPIDVLTDELAASCNLGYSDFLPNFGFRLNACAKGSTSGERQDLLKNIHSILAAIDMLSSVAHSEFQRADRRELDVGWQAGPERPEGRIAIPGISLVAIAKAGLEFQVTIYPSSEYDEDQHRWSEGQ